MEGSLITIKEEFLSSTKTRLAVKLGGWEVIALWLAMRGYVSAGNTGGFVPRESIDDLPGIPRNWGKAMNGLLGCGKLKLDGSRGPGLVVAVEHGFVFHDYDDHGTAPEAEELRRQRARDQKRRRREELAKLSADKTGQKDRTSGGQVSDKTDTQEPDSAPDNQPDSHARADTGAAAHGHAGNPSPAQPNPKAVADAPIPCPRDLALTPDQRATLETSMIPGWAIEVLTSKFVGKAIADPDDKRPLVAWRKCLSVAISGDWNGPNRPKQHVAEKPADNENGGYGAGEGFAV